ncbi:MAG: putative ABC exporter domain-containing protein [Vulcanimicrobiaceae bacterium]
MLAQFNALAYLEFRQVVNFARGAIRNPSRIIVWTILIAWIGFTIYARAGSGMPHGSPFGTAAILPSMFGFAGLGIFASALFQGTKGRVATFSNVADARFLIGSHLNPRIVIFWLQIRNSALIFLRISLVILANVLLFSHGNGLASFLGISGLLVLFTVTPLPTFELSRRLPSNVVAIVATVLTIASFLALALSAATFAFPSLSSVALFIEHTGVGWATMALWSGTPVAIATLWGINAVIIALGEFGATDIYPELYASTLTWAARWSRARGWNHLSRPKAGVKDVRSISTPFQGVMVAFWKEQIAYMRSPGVRTMFLVELGVAVISGITAGIIGRHDQEALGTIIGAAFTIIILLLALSGTSLVHDISKPIWWLGTGSTLAKLTTWSVATSLDSIVILALGSLSLGIASGNAVYATIGITLALLVPSFVRAIGVATYSFLPAAIDQRGPVAVLRALMLYVLFAPPVALGIFVGIQTSNAYFGVATALVVTILEGMLALVVAAKKIEGRGAEYATAEVS